MYDSSAKPGRGEMEIYYCEVILHMKWYNTALSWIMLKI